jgi:hypothetical protein
VPEKSGEHGYRFSPFSNRADMSSRAGLEAEAITRLTDGVQPPEIRAILVQCLAGEVAPSTGIARMLAEKGAATVRAAIDEVTHRAATISRASDMLVHDRVDELTQVFVEHVAELADVSDGAKSRPGRERKTRDGKERASPPEESADHGEARTSE